MVASILAACAAVAILPVVAHAKSYSMPHVNIQMQVETDGSLHVVEQRTFDFDGDFSAAWWVLDSLPDNAKIEVDGVRIGSIDEQGRLRDGWKQLESVPFVLSWRDEGGPETPAYSLDGPKDTLYVFFRAADTRMMVELDYTVRNGVKAYSDIGEVNWRYIATDWDAPSEDVTMTMTLPVPGGAKVEPGDTVRAWGHGPEDGTVSVARDGSVTYRLDEVGAGQYADAHVVFPSAWLTNLSADARREHSGMLRLDSVLDEEESWVDGDHQARMGSYGFGMACAVVCASVLAWALVLFVLRGREHKPDFTGLYWRELPDAALHPAVIGRLWRWNRESRDDLAATIVHLLQAEVVQLDGDRLLRFSPASASSLAEARGVDALDRAALDVLFGVEDPAAASAMPTASASSVASATPSAHVASNVSDVSVVAARAENAPDAFSRAVASWNAVLADEVEAAQLFDARSRRCQRQVLVAAGVLLLASIAAFAMTGDAVSLLLGVLTALALIVLGNYMPRRSERGNNVAARCKALRNWLRDDDALGESDRAAFDAYSIVFGIPNEASPSVAFAIDLAAAVDDATLKISKSERA